MSKADVKASVSFEDSTLFLYGDIGDDWGGIELETVKEASDSIKGDSVTVHINSNGGSATTGVAIYNYLKNRFNQIDVVVDGIAASAASIVAMCGDTLTMNKGTTLMIHNPWTITYGNADELRKEIKALEALEKSYRDIYMEKFNGTEQELIELLDNETWLSAEQAEFYGFATARGDSQQSEKEGSTQEAKASAEDSKDYGVMTFDPEKRKMVDDEVQEEEDTNSQFLSFLKLMNKENV